MTLASEVGVSQPTATAWARVLAASFLTFTLAPHFKNFSKRLIKSPKVYFYDTGLLCYLLRITSPTQLETHPLRGFIFENWVILEVMKSYFNLGQEAPLYFWRDQHGHEVDLVVDHGTSLLCTEIKSAATFHPEFAANIRWLNQLQRSEGGRVVYGGDQGFQSQGIDVIPWRQLYRWHDTVLLNMVIYTNLRFLLRSRATPTWFPRSNGTPCSTGFNSGRTCRTQTC